MSSGACPRGLWTAAVSSHKDTCRSGPGPILTTPFEGPGHTARGWVGRGPSACLSGCSGLPWETEQVRRTPEEAGPVVLSTFSPPQVLGQLKVMVQAEDQQRGVRPGSPQTSHSGQR